MGNNQEAPTEFICMMKIHPQGNHLTIGNGTDAIGNFPTSEKGGRRGLLEVTRKGFILFLIAVESHFVL